MSRELAVLLYGQHIGTVHQNDHGRRQFAYAASYGGTDSTPLSLSMPVSHVPYKGRVIDPYMAGLLPDNQQVRERWAARWGVSSANPFALLTHMGMDCAGAVQFVTTDQVDEALGRPQTLQRVSDADLEERLASLRKDESSWTVPGERWSLAGAQGKFTLRRNRSGDWFEPSGAAASTHIVKPGVSGYRDQALNEHLCLQTAANCGLQAAATEYVMFGEQPALVVTRYDRRRRGDDVVRLHQEDLCQAKAVDPKRKYEASKGPGAAAIAALLWDQATDPETDVRRFLTAVAFNYLIGAPDAHAKNYSVLLAGPQVRLAPLYDVASALPYEPTHSDSEIDRAAMAVGGRRIFGEVAGRHWDKMARSCHFSEGELRTIVARLAEQLPEELEQVAGAERHASDELSTRLTDRVRANCQTAARKLAE